MQHLQSELENRLDFLGDSFQQFALTKLQWGSFDALSTATEKLIEDNPLWPPSELVALESERKEEERGKGREGAGMRPEEEGSTQSENASSDIIRENDTSK